VARRQPLRITEGGFIHGDHLGESDPHGNDLILDVDSGMPPRALAVQIDLEPVLSVRDDDIILVPFGRTSIPNPQQVAASGLVLEGELGRCRDVHCTRVEIGRCVWRRVEWWLMLGEVQEIFDGKQDPKIAGVRGSLRARI
jgi:hypothetical protein